MKRKPQRGDLGHDRDGVRVVYDERRGLRTGVPLIAIFVFGVLASFLVLRRADVPAPAVAPEPGKRADVVTESAHIPARAAGREAAVDTEKHQVLPRRRGGAGLQPNADVARTSAELERAGDTGEKTHPENDARDFIAALRESGETAGFAAFSPPGTRPPRPGVIVPANYQLPEGFARHYQTTDDGRQLAPVLVVAPGYEIVDDAGDPVALTDDRIVPPEYAPPDLPVQMLDIPSEHGPGEEVP
jgi:hypothetical protein